VSFISFFCCDAHILNTVEEIGDDDDNSSIGVEIDH